MAHWQRILNYIIKENISVWLTARFMGLDSTKQLLIWHKESSLIQTTKLKGQLYFPLRSKRVLSIPSTLTMSVAGSSNPSWPQIYFSVLLRNLITTFNVKRTKFKNKLKEAGAGPNLKNIAVTYLSIDVQSLEGEKWSKQCRYSLLYTKKGCSCHRQGLQTRFLPRSGFFSREFVHDSHTMDLRCHRYKGPMFHKF